MASELSFIISQLSGEALFIGSVARARALGELAAGLLILDPTTRRSKLGRDVAGLRLVRADPVFPPLGAEELDLVIVAGELGRQADGLKAVSAWRDLLRPGGLLLILEPISVTPIVGSLSRLISGAPAFRPPEAVSGMLLNAGLAAVGQQILQGQPSGVLTRGTKRIHVVAWEG